MGWHHTLPSVLSPWYRLSGSITALGVSGLAVVLGIPRATGLPLSTPWLAAVAVASLLTGLFGLTLLVQAALIRLEFNDNALTVGRQGPVIRRFPYQQWLGWRLFWPAVPMLFYFREVNGIHFLPVLFKPEALEEQLRYHIGPPLNEQNIEREPNPVESGSEL